MYKANLSFTQLNYYLKIMQEYDLITQNGKEGKILYSTTGKGSEFLQIHSEIIKLLRENSTQKNTKIPPESLLKKHDP